MECYNQQLGAYGETLAADFFSRRGYKILDKNFRTRHGEIDLIIQKDNEILFIEVKTRTSETFGYPENAVDYKKTRHLLEAIRIYLDQIRRHYAWRLDIISVEINKSAKTAKIIWFKGL